MSHCLPGARDVIMSIDRLQDAEAYRSGATQLDADGATQLVNGRASLRARSGL